MEQSLKIRLCPRYSSLPDSVIEGMRVEVVDISEGGRIRHQIFSNLKEASKKVDLSKFMGIMYGRISGQDALRFESKEAYARLSQ